MTSSRSSLSPSRHILTSFDKEEELEQDENYFEDLPDGKVIIEEDEEQEQEEEAEQPKFRGFPSGQSIRSSRAGSL